jgi:hypothetical protein
MWVISSLVSPTIWISSQFLLYYTVLAWFYALHGSGSLTASIYPLTWRSASVLFCFLTLLESWSVIDFTQHCLLTCVVANVWGDLDLTVPCYPEVWF